MVEKVAEDGNHSLAMDLWPGVSDNDDDDDDAGADDDGTNDNDADHDNDDDDDDENKTIIMTTMTKKIVLRSMIVTKRTMMTQYFFILHCYY